MLDRLRDFISWAAGTAAPVGAIIWLIACYIDAMLNGAGIAKWNIINIFLQ